MPKEEDIILEAQPRWKQNLSGGNEMMCIAEALRDIADTLKLLTKFDIGKGGNH